MSSELALVQTFRMNAKTSQAKARGAKIAEGRTVKIECSASDKSAAISMAHAGSALESTEGVLVTKEKSRLTVLIPSFSRATTGVYECRQRSRDNVVSATRLRLGLARGNVDPLSEEFGECTDPNFRKGYCMNGGTCYVNSISGVYICRCQSGFSGPQCETRDVFITDASTQYLQTAIGALTGLLCATVVLIVLLGAVMLYKCRRKSRRISTYLDDEPITPVLLPPGRRVCEACAKASAGPDFGAVPALSDVPALSRPLLGLAEDQLNVGHLAQHALATRDPKAGVSTSWWGTPSDVSWNKGMWVGRKQFKRSRKLGVSHSDLDQCGQTDDESEGTTDDEPTAGRQSKGSI
jgi:hypothetical protein